MGRPALIVIYETPIKGTCRRKKFIGDSLPSSLASCDVTKLTCAELMKSSCAAEVQAEEHLNHETSLEHPPMKIVDRQISGHPAAIMMT